VSSLLLHPSYADLFFSDSRDNKVDLIIHMPASVEHIPDGQDELKGRIFSRTNADTASESSNKNRHIWMRLAAVTLSDDMTVFSASLTTALKY
jgi:acyl-CoA thioesterase